MDPRRDALDRMLEAGVVPVLRDIDPDDVVPVGRALADGGVTALEVTADTSGAVDALERLVGAMTDRDVVVGVGTVTDAETAGTMIRAGASFVVTPAFSEPVVDAANARGIPVVPGIMTPTEALAAYRAGADAIKLFPARTVGPGHLAAMRGPLDQLTVIPTGGITRENAGAFLQAGAAGIGVGSALVEDTVVAERRWDELAARASRFVEIVQEHRQRSAIPPDARDG